ncbi:MMPL family transporter [Wandonia haliotis]|uniref:MMPL family transporter n=1 Tax=Wandonia haliotis TaxID=574963 RepID=A0ABP3Y321_9FLAO
MDEVVEMLYSFTVMIDEVLTQKVGEKKLKKYSRWIILVLTSLTLFFLYNWKHLGFTYEFEDFLPKGNSEADFFADYRDRFSSDNDFILLAIEREAGIFEENFLKDIEKISDDLKGARYVEQVVSLTTLKEFRLLPGGVAVQIPYLHLDSLRLDKDSARIFSHPELVNRFIASDAKSLCIFLKHRDYIGKEKCDTMVADIRTILSGYNFDQIRLTGRAVGQQYYVKKMQNEMMLFVSLSVVLVILFLFIAFRSVWGILLPQVVLFGALIWVIGAMGLFREPINVLLIVLPSIMFVVAMSDVIHMVSKYIDNLREGIEKIPAIKNTMKEIGMATLLTSVTTAVGFATLFLIGIRPIQVFGIYTALGVLLAFLLTFFVLPVLFLFTRTPKVVRESKYNTPVWFGFLSKCFRYTLTYRKWIPAGFLIFGLVAVYGISKIETNNYLMDDISEDTPMKQDFNYLDQHYGGVRPFELAIVLVDSTASFWDKEVLIEIQQIEEYLELEYGVGRINSLPSMLKVANRSLHAGQKDWYRLPESNRELNRVRRMITAKGDELLAMLIDSSGRMTRISGGIPDWGNKIVTEKNKKLLDFIRREVDTTRIRPVITGTAHLLDVNMRTLSASMMQGLVLASAIIALLMGVLYRSFSMVVIALIPNIFPLLFIGGIMGFLGVDLKITTAIVFTIAFGIAVDDTIHFLSKFKLELNKGKKTLEALRVTYVSTGKAIILTTLILSSGFLMLLFSDFEGTFIMGLLVSLSLVFAVIADLLLLPVLIVFFFRKK